MFLADMVQPAGPFQIVVEYANAGETLLGAQTIENVVDDLAEVVAVLAGARGSLVRERTLFRFGRFEHLDRL